MRALWRGDWIADTELADRIKELGDRLAHSMPAPLGTETLLKACEALSARLLGTAPDPDRDALAASLRMAGAAERDIRCALEELGTFLERENLEKKLRRELSAGDARKLPFRLERISYSEEILEAWAPLGFLVHIAPTNSVNVPVLSVVEGLLCGNVCFLKTGGSDSDYALLALRALAESDLTGQLREFVHGARIPSRDRMLLRQLLAQADGIAVWGSEEAVAGVRELAPVHARIIDWGHKISLGYVGASMLKSPELGTMLRGLARDCCLLEQQACSSPQVIYADTRSREALEDFTRRFAEAMEEVSAGLPVARAPTAPEQAELTRVCLIAEVETCVQEPGRASTFLVLRGNNWTVLATEARGLRASPLFRTIWIKPLPETAILTTLRPMRHYLQTIGLAVDRADLHRVSSLFFRAGALRISAPGRMQDGYVGEPHDGVLALTRYARRVSLRADGIDLRGISALDELAAPAPALSPSGAEAARHVPAPIMTKEDFTRQVIAPRDSQLHFRSGGSSGEPKLSVFTYDDYHRQMKAAAQGLFAAGLEPATDRCMNLFAGGGLYGGFVSFFTILEELHAVQFPMAAHADLAAVARAIVKHGVTTLLGMPSYLLPLFRENEELLRNYRGVRKVFFAGEHFSAAQQAYLRKHFGVTLIRSAAYGGNDTGPMGFQCPHCPDAVHHLHEHLHDLEIEDGRMLLTARARRGQRLARYDLGDLGRWWPDQSPCPCGRSGRRFELLGRHGDVFKAGGSFLNYRNFARALAEALEFSGEFQLVIDQVATERLTLRHAGHGAQDGALPASALMRKACLDSYPDLAEVVNEEKVLEFRCEAVAPSALERIPGSGKLRQILDLRKQGD